MSLAHEYFRRLHQQLEELERRSLSAIEQVAACCAQCLMNGGVIHLFDTGHFVSREFLNRAGGLAAFSPLAFDLSVNNPNPYRDRLEGTPQDRPETVRCLVSAALDRSRVRPGDVLIIGSVSGKTPLPVELALQAKKQGVTVVAVTSLDYSSRLQAEHESGKRLFEVVDFVIDNAAPYGDGMMRLEGLEVPFCPASGISAAAALWAVVASLIEQLLAQGRVPTVFSSINLPDGPERYRQALERYAEKGF